MSPVTPISIIVPVLDEADQLPTTLGPLQALRGNGLEIIVADGGSQDETVQLAGRLADRVLEARRGRARQMNAGAAAARGEILLFLHADTQLPPSALLELAELDPGPALWGRLPVRLSGGHPLFRVIERGIRARARLTGVVTGDQALFVSRDCFRTAGGFPDFPLMEDVALSKRLRRLSRPRVLHSIATTSSRRWEEGGILRTVLLMWRLRLAYFLGAEPARLAQVYEGRDAAPGDGRE